MQIKIKSSIIWRVLLGLVVVGIIAGNGFWLYRVRGGAGFGRGAGNAVENADVAELTLTVISAKDCKECFDTSELLSTIRESDKVKVVKDNTYDRDSRKGKKLIEQYGITRLPAVLINGNVEKIFDVASFTQNLGKQAEDGTLVMTNIPPPYLDLATGNVKGKFTAIYVTDKTCTDCYDIGLHKQALEGLLMIPAEEKFYDRAEEEGKRLIEAYKIIAVPTLLLQGEMDAFPQLQQVWPTVGTIEADGTYVFRSGLKQMGNYFDLKTNKLVKAELPESK